MTIREALIALNVLEEDASQKRAISSNLRILLVHMLKATYQPEYENKNSWRNSILNSYNQIVDEFPDFKGTIYRNFYLKNLDIEKIYQSAKIVASEKTGKSKNIFPVKCPWTKEQLVNPEFISEFMDTYCPR